MIIIIIILAVLTIVGIVLEQFDNGILADILVIFAAFFLIITLICIPVFRMSIQGDIVQYNSLKQTVTNARNNKSISEFEKASMQNEIIKGNQTIQSDQYWSKGTFSIYYPKEIRDIQLIK